MNKKIKTISHGLLNIAIGAVIVSASTFSITSCSKSSDSSDESKKIVQVKVPTPEELGVKLIEGGTFLMGSATTDLDAQSDERPQHKVTVSSFRTNIYEITNAQYAVFLTAKGNQSEDSKKWYQGSDIEQQGTTFVPKSGRENYPVVNVSWYGAKAYAEWAGGKLPTEAEFEYLLREGNVIKNEDGTVGNQGIFADDDGTGANIGDYAWYSLNSGNQLHPVGQKKPNKLGLYDVNGNAWEWTNDWYASYSGDDQTNPTGAASGAFRVRRGASFSCTHDKTRIANRGTYTARDGQPNVTFRVVFPANKQL